MPNSHKLRQCLICSEAHKVMVSLDQLWNELDTLTIARVLQNLHFPNISDVKTIGGALCFTCLTKLHSCYQLKITCDQIEKQFELDATIPPLHWYRPKIMTQNIEGKGIKGPITRADISKPTTIDDSTIKYAIDIDSEISAETGEQLDNIAPENWEPNENLNTTIEETNDVHIKSEIEVDEGIFALNVGNHLTSGTTVESPERNIKILRVKTYRCPVCAKAFEYNNVLRRHLKIHAQKPYVCDVCNKSMALISELKIHQMIHRGEKPFVCDVCDMKFARKSDLRVHKMVHSGEKPYVCDVCNKSFRRIIELDYHKVKHTGEKPYVCDVCDKSFTQKIGLQDHKLRHTGEKPHGCDVCDKLFFRKTDLTAHKMLHTGEKPYVCHVCNKSFATKAYLQIHKVVHTGERPHVCDVCNRSFTFKQALKRHKVCHTREKSSVIDSGDKS